MNSELKRQGNKNSERINIHNDFMGPLQWSKDCLDLFIGQNQLLGHGFVIFVSVTHEWRHKGYTEQSKNIFLIFQK